MLNPDAALQARAAAAVRGALDANDVVLLGAADAHDTMALLRVCDLNAACVMLDPWYNKGVGGVRADYDEYLVGLMAAAGLLAPHVYVWGFPEILGPFVGMLPEGLALEAWLTWYYKNNPSVIRGWRSAQMTCLHLVRPDALMHPEHFLNEAQLAKLAAGKLRYLPGPTSVLDDPADHPEDVIESALLVGFVGRAEQTGHPSQKPVKVYDKLVRMASLPGDLVIDPMAGSGTTAAACRALGRRALLADGNEEYLTLMEQRLGISRLVLPEGTFV